MSIDRTCQQLVEHVEEAKNLDVLATLLREESERSSEVVKNTIPIVLPLVDHHPMEVLRVLINFTADNLENRQYMVSNEPEVSEFWTTILGLAACDNAISQVASRLMILNTQFVRTNEDEKLNFLEQLMNHKVIQWVWDYYKICVEKDLESIDYASEVLTDFANKFPNTVNADQISLVIQGLDKLLEQQIEEDLEDTIMAHILLLVHVTDVDDSTLPIPINHLLKCIKKIPSDYEGSTRMKRNLFAVCGNVFSYPSFNNFEFIEESISTITSSLCGYSVAAAAISISNCVTDKAKRSQVVEKIESISSITIVGQAILNFPFTDVVQLQAFHFFNNCMTKVLADSLLEKSNQAALYKSTKIVVDNYKYYPQIGLIYLRFLGRLVTLGYLTSPKNDPVRSKEVWNYLDNLEDYCEVRMLLLQGLCTKIDNPEAVEIARPIVDQLLEIKTSGIDSRELLTKLTTLAIFVQTLEGQQLINFYGGNEEEFVEKMNLFLLHLSRILDEQSSEQGGNEQAKAAIENNIHFVAAAYLKKLESLQQFTKKSETQEICLAIVRKPRHGNF